MESKWHRVTDEDPIDLNYLVKGYIDKTIGFFREFKQENKNQLITTLTENFEFIEADVIEAISHDLKSRWMEVIDAK